MFEALARHLPGDAIVTVDVGNHAYSLGRYWESAGQPVLMSGYLGSIGFGYPAALGAWAAAHGRPILAVTGDGGFGQYSAEILTAVKYGIPIKHLLLDNGSLGKISKEQLAAGLPVWHTSLHNPDWAAYAELCGATGIRVDRRDELDDGLTRSSPRTALPCSASNKTPSSSDDNERTTLITTPGAYDDLRALFINCTLKPSPEISNTQGLIEASAGIMRTHGVAVDVVRAVDHDIATGVWPDMREHGAATDDWPAIFETVLAADILVLAGPIWLGDNSSVMKQVHERLYGGSHLLNDAGQYLYYGRVGRLLHHRQRGRHQALRDERALHPAAHRLHDPAAGGRGLDR